jgi:hypothetical protein
MTSADESAATSNFRFGKNDTFFVILSVAKESGCAKMLRKSRFLFEIQILSLRSE